MNDLKKWIKCASIRAIRTMAQTAGGLITVGALITDINWLTVASASLVAGIYSIITSLAGLPEMER